MAREPHNSIISVAARLGVIGLVFWVGMQIALFRAWYAARSMARRLEQPETLDRLFVLLAFFVIVLGMAYGEDAFEKPYFAIPYYCFWGIVLRMLLDLRTASARLSGYNEHDSSCFWRRDFIVDPLAGGSLGSP